MIQVWYLNADYDTACECRRIQKEHAVREERIIKAREKYEKQILMALKSAMNLFRVKILINILSSCGSVKARELKRILGRVGK